MRTQAGSLQFAESRPQGDAVLKTLAYMQLFDQNADGHFLPNASRPQANQLD
jgi:hypothetical protein